MSIHTLWAIKRGVPHGQAQPNKLHDDRTPALGGNTGASPNHTFNATVRAASEGYRASQAGNRSFADSDECPRRQPAGRQLIHNAVAPNSIVFADRPVRAAGHSLTTDLLEEWSKSNNSDESFAKDPPNATVSVFSKDGSKIQDAVVVLKTAKLEGDRLTFDVDVLEGELAGGDGPAALFTDRFGFGGFHAGGFHAGGFGGFHAGGGFVRGGAVGVGRVGAAGVWHRPYFARGAWYRGGYGAAAVGAAAVGGAALGAAGS
jgi:hypothetical protein